MSGVKEVKIHIFCTSSNTSANLFTPSVIETHRYSATLALELYAWFISSLTKLEIVLILMEGTCLSPLGCQHS